MELNEWRVWWKYFGFTELRHLLLLWWDPIGVYGDPAAVDEYDHYVDQLGRMLSDVASEEQVAAYLGCVSSQEMGLATPDLGRQAAAKVIEWHSQALRQRDQWKPFE